MATAPSGSDIDPDREFIGEAPIAVAQNGTTGTNHAQIGLMLLQPAATSPQSALIPGGPAAARIDELWTFMLWSGTTITIIVVAALLFALFRQRDAEPAEADQPPDPRGKSSENEPGGRDPGHRHRWLAERTGVRVMVGAGIVFPGVMLLVIHLLTMRTLDAVAMPAFSIDGVDAPPRAGELAIEVTGLQYWWRVVHLDAVPARRFETANEIRIPVGRPVTIRLRSGDVIHSFWVPGLHGKMDLVPGRTNALSIQADTAGIWRGQCAEFCGVQHTMMALVVVAMEPDAFEQWSERQRQPAPTPADSGALADQQRFLASGCVFCHAVRGTVATGSRGPDLTHIASRLTLAAGTLPNTVGHRYGWIANPQAIKPGSLMPTVPMSVDDLHAIVRYLSTLE